MREALTEQRRLGARSRRAHGRVEHHRRGGVERLLEAQLVILGRHALVDVVSWCRFDSARLMQTLVGREAILAGPSASPALSRHRRRFLASPAALQDTVPAFVDGIVLLPDVAVVFADSVAVDAHPVIQDGLLRSVRHHEQAVRQADDASRVLERGRTRARSRARRPPQMQVGRRRVEQAIAQAALLVTDLLLSHLLGRRLDELASRAPDHRDAVRTRQ